MRKIFCILMLFLLIFSCKKEDKDPKVIKFGLTPWQKNQTGDDINKLYTPLMEYLGKNTGKTFVVQTAKDYKEAIDMIANGTVQLCNLSPVPYVEAKKKNAEIELLVTELNYNEDKTVKKDSYFGYIVALKTRNDLKDIQSLKGKKFGFVSLESSSGYVYPEAIFRSMNIDYKTYFSEAKFLGSHPNVTDAIVKGDIDAGATWDFNLGQAVKKNGDVYKIIFTTPPIPNLCIAAGSISPELKAKIKELLVNVDPKTIEGLPAIGYVVKDDSFYDTIRKLFQ